MMTDDSALVTVTWDERFVLGLTQIDEQHQQLIAYINLLGSSVEANSNHDIVCHILSGLTEYAHEHFAVEENLMADYGYPRAQAHEGNHEEFKGVIKLYRKRMQQRADKALLCRELHDFLAVWLIDHILVQDLELVQYLRAKGAT